MTSLQDGIVSAFIDRKTRELKDTDVSIALSNRGIPCDSDDLRRHLQSLSPGLFQLIFNPDKTITIRLEPTIEICEPFLTTRCPAPAKTCKKLHICRHFGRCTQAKCNFPHDLSRGFNRTIIAEHHCQHINPFLLVELLRCPKFSISAPAKRGFRGSRGRNRGRGRGTRNYPSGRDFPTKTDDLDRQVDVSFPSARQNASINTSDLGLLLLTLRGIKVKDTVEEKDGDYCRLATLQLERINDVEKLLNSPILQHHGVDIKFKRTKQMIDKTSFIIKTSISDERDKIDPFRLELYIHTLVDKSLVDTISDLSTDSEQIMLTQCKGEIDFDKVRQKNLAKPQLSGKDVSLIQIYECDALEIQPNNTNESITENDLKRIFHSVWRDIFAYNLSSSNPAAVQFINVDAFKQWMSTIDHVQSKFHVTINPMIDSVEENSIDTCSNVSSEHETRPHQTTLKLRNTWALIAAHRNFKLEYKDFIHQEFGGDVDINDDEVIYTGAFPPHVHGQRDSVVLGNKTNEFMKRFQWRTFEQLDENQMQILRNNSDTVAYTRNEHKEYIVATKLRDMPGLERQLFPDKNSPKPTYSKVNPSRNDTLVRLPKTAVPSSTTTMYHIIPPERMSIFAMETFEDRLQRYLQETFHVNLTYEKSNNEKSRTVKSGIRLKITGEVDDAVNASEDLNNLFDSLCTKKFSDKIDGNWTKIEEATQVINHHFQLFDMICICEQISSTEVSVSYFDITNPRFGTDEQKIEELIKDRFRSASIPLNQQTLSAKLTKDWTNLEEEIRRRDDYKKKICMSKESNTIYLFGSPELVKEFRQKFEQLKHKYNPQPCKITLTERQLNYLASVAKGDLNKLEKEYKSDGCDFSLARLRDNCEFLAPVDMHSDIKDKLLALAQIRETSFDIVEPGFEVLLSEEPERLLNLVRSKCFLEKTIDTHRDHIPIPKARAAGLDDRMKQPTGATASSNTAISANIGHSTVTISMGDLAKQAVDAIVLCSSSRILCRDIVHWAGDQVKQNYDALESSGNFPSTIPGGALPCKRIIFVPWAPTSHKPADVKSSLNSFVTLAFMHALSDGCKSIAFHAVGCGKLGFDPFVIGKYMLRETREQLKTSKSKMNISFVLLADQQNVYDAFIKCLNDLESIDLTVAHKIPLKRKDDRSTIPYDRKTVKITLISSSDNHLVKCREDILKLVRSSSITSQIAKQEMLDWPQKAIYKYYEYCLDKRVIPTLDLEKTILELVGPKEAVHEAEKYFYQLTAEILNEQRIHAVSQGVIWSAELTPNTDTWEQYSYKLNGAIEDAHSRGHTQVNYENEIGEKCQIIFSKMEETSASSKSRRVRRVLVDSTLPKAWKISNQNCTRVVLDQSSPEYQNVLAQFHVTMLGKYTQIIKIERIQNERWYKQYAAHRDEFRKRYPKDDERLLFHGCPSASADQIIEKCFNRSFAGVNGTSFGHGVYFHAQASYSHQYAYANSAGERTMFLTRVLIGKTCKGDTTMKVVPPGYDTTTDGQHISVVYHDAGAYADHLITYK